MTQADLPFKRPTRRDALAALFRARPGQWIPVTEMARVTGVSGVRERRRECERELNMKLERREWTDAEGYRHVDWRFLPALPREAA